MGLVTEAQVERYRRVLGLKPSATLVDVRRNYRREIRRWHPDVAGGDGERARLLNEAEEYLTLHPAAIRPSRVDESPAPDARPGSGAGPSSSTPPPGRETSPAAGPSSSAPRRVTTVAAVLGWLGALYVALLVFAIIGYLVTTILPLLASEILPIVF